jgi:hypothetical protein
MDKKNKNKNLEDKEKIKISSYLKPDTPDIKKLTTIFKREEEYGNFLFVIESIISDEYLENKNLTDKEVINSLKLIKENYDKEISFFKKEYEKRIIYKFSVLLEKEGITKHEFKLIFNYVLWVIDNRSWMGDRQAYIKWVVYFLDKYSKKEKENYEKETRKLLKDLGAPEDKINEVLEIHNNKIPKVMNEMEDELTKTESEYFQLNEDEKFEFVLNNFMKNPFLVNDFTNKMFEKETVKKAIDLHLKLIERYPKFFPLEIMLAGIYLEIDEKKLALQHVKFGEKLFEEVLKQNLIPKEEEKEIRDSIKEIVKECET